jgi:hypothetical protein
VLSFILKGILYMTILIRCAEASPLDSLDGVDIVLVGINHPLHPMDNITFPRIADSLCNKSAYFDKAYSFRNGAELLNILKTLTSLHHKIGNLAILGHSGYQGYFVEDNSGFYTDNYTTSYSGQKIKFTNCSARVKDLKQAIEKKEIVFSEYAVIVLIGCNTAYGDNNLAADLAALTHLTVIGSGQKVDLYNVSNMGEEMKGLERETFYAYVYKDQKTVKYNFDLESINISRAIEIVNSKK